MSRFFYPDPDESGWTVVSYINPDHVVPSNPKHRAEFLKERDRRDLARDAKMDRDRKRSNDMHYVYVREHLNHCRQWAQRIRRDPRYAHMLAYEPEYYIYNPSDYQISSRDLQWCGGCERYVYPKYMTSILCTHCMALPIPMSSSQNWNPVIIDKRVSGEGVGEVLRDAYERHSRGKHRGKTGPSAAKIERAAEDGALAPLKTFTPEFIRSVVDARLKKELSQEALAMLINRTVGDVSLFERGDLPFDPALKSQLAWKLELA